MDPAVILVRVLLGSILLIVMTTGQAVPQTSGFTRVPNNILNTMIRLLARQTRNPNPTATRSVNPVDPTRSLTPIIVGSRAIGDVNRRNRDPLTTSRTLTPRVAATRVQPIDEIIEGAESTSPTIRREDQRQLRRLDSLVIEGDMVMDQAELADIDKQIRLDRLEERLLLNQPEARRNDMAFRDILRARLERRETTSPVRRQKRAARRSRRRRWPDGLVNVRIASSGFTRAQKNRIARSMNEISEKTCICFNIISRTQALGRVPHLRIVNGNGCRSYVGRNLRNQGGTRSQDLTLAPRCRRTRVVTHEFLHAIGFFHEQSRPDRSSFVDILRSNVRPGKRGNFKRYSRATIDSRGLPYDYRSIMHYSNRAFSRNGRFTIVPKPRANRNQFLDRIGRSTEMSENDAEGIRRMYSCPSSPNTSQSSCSGYPYRFP